MAKRSASHADRLAQSQALRASLKEAGLRGTPARIAVLQILRETPSPVAHAEVAEKLEALGVDKATVLRNLTDLVNAGLARRSELGDHLWRYEAMTEGASEEPHPHFLCLDCGTIQCIDKLQLSPVSRRSSEAIGVVTEILLKGHCNTCLGRAS